MCMAVGFSWSMCLLLVADLGTPLQLRCSPGTFRPGPVNTRSVQLRQTGSSPSRSSRARGRNSANLPFPAPHHGYKSGSMPASSLPPTPTPTPAAPSDVIFCLKMHISAPAACLQSAPHLAHDVAKSKVSAAATPELHSVRTRELAPPPRVPAHWVPAPPPSDSRPFETMVERLQVC